jgi:hypothetical protein
MKILRKYIPLIAFAAATVTFSFFDFIQIGSQKLSGLQLLRNEQISVMGNSYYLEPRLFLIIFFIILIIGMVICIINLFLKNNLSKTIFTVSLLSSLVIILEKTIFSNKLTPERWNSGHLIPVEYSMNFWFTLILLVFAVVYLYFISIAEDSENSMMYHERNSK